MCHMWLSNLSPELHVMACLVHLTVSVRRMFKGRQMKRANYNKNGT
jgi:hypothetical protein